MFSLEANLLTPKESFLLEEASGGTPRWHDWFSYKVSGDNLVEGSTNGLRLRDSEWTWNKILCWVHGTRNLICGLLVLICSTSGSIYMYRAVCSLVDTVYQPWYIGGTIFRHLLVGSCLRGKGWA